MPSSILLLPTIIHFLLTLTRCSANGPSPSGPSGPSGPNEPNGPGWDCKFQPPSGCGPDTTSPDYNACLVRDSSVSEFIQCAAQKSTISSGDSDDENQNPINAFDVLVSAITIQGCKKCNIGTKFSNYSSRPDKSVKLVNYLCGKVNDADICCLSGCMKTREPEHSLMGICKNNDINLQDNGEPNCGGASGAGDGGGGGDGGDGGDGSSITTDQAAASSSSTIVTSASEPTVTPSASSSIAAQTTVPAQTASSSPTGSSGSGSSSASNAGSRVLKANVISSGLLIVILTACVKLVLAGAGAV